MSNSADNSASDAASSPIASVAPSSHSSLNGARTGTVVWGFIILGVAALAFTTTQWDLSDYHPGIITAWVAVGLGALAIVGGLVAAVVRRARG